MPDDKPTGLASVGGDALLGYGGQDPRCNGRCRGSERNRLDSPAIFARRPDNSKGIYCPCCDHFLRRAKPGETGLADGSTVQLPTMTPDVAARARFFIDDICKYQVVVFKEIVAAGDKSATAPEART